MPTPILRFVHTADLHLDSPFSGMKAVAPDRVTSMLQQATFEAYDNIIDLCINEQVDALLIAGDVYDSADRNLPAQLKFLKGLDRLDAAGIRSFVCHGNHDPLDGWEAKLDYPPLAYRFGEEFQAVPVFPDEPQRAVVYGISYPTRDVRENLVARLGTVNSEAYSIGLLHANVGNNTEHESYAPCTLNDLAMSGVDYWALGHVHTRQILLSDHPTVVYPGNPQGRHPNERGARGVYLVEVDELGNASLEFMPIDTVRWESLELDIRSSETEQALLDQLETSVLDTLANADGRSVVARIRLSGRGPMHDSLKTSHFSPDKLTEQLNDTWAHEKPFMWCERVVDETSSELDREELQSGTDFIADLLQLRDQARHDKELLTRISAGLDSLYSHNQYAQYLSEIVPKDDDLNSLIDEAEAIAVDLLVGENNS